MKPRIGSLASGYGGLDMAVLAVFGGEVVWHLEYDAAPSKILAHHYPTIPNHGDITKTDWTTVEPIDVLTGGYPCQPFSRAGQRKGTNDHRHIWPWIADAIRVLRPRVCVFENVAGHLGLGFDAVLSDLAALGMDVRWGLVRASDAGAPHERERLFIVAYAHGEQDRATERDSIGLVGEGGPLRRVRDAGPDPESGPGSDVSTFEVGAVRFGPFSEAVARWSRVVGSPPPRPNDDRARLSAPFVEWLMGLPSGHVTDPAIGLSRAQQLRALGNGVCPQQARLAIELLTK